jgi:hypothetical protein
MTTHFHHCIVWLDHREARVFQLNPGELEPLVLRPDHPTRHIHHKANSIGSGHAPPDPAFLQAVAHSLAKSGAILIAGPGLAKTELVKHLHQHDPKLIAAIAGIETVDHPTDGALVAHAEQYFGTPDRRIQRHYG